MESTKSLSLYENISFEKVVLPLLLDEAYKVERPRLIPCDSIKLGLNVRTLYLPWAGKGCQVTLYCDVTPANPHPTTLSSPLQPLHSWHWPILISQLQFFSDEHSISRTEIYRPTINCRCLLSKGCLSLPLPPLPPPSTAPLDYPLRLHPFPSPRSHRLLWPSGTCLTVLV